jgi:hypothetical protein
MFANCRPLMFVALGVSLALAVATLSTAALSSYAEFFLTTALLSFLC